MYGCKKFSVVRFFCERDLKTKQIGEGITLRAVSGDEPHLAFNYIGDLFKGMFCIGIRA
jgi:hypothetical protein